MATAKTSSEVQRMMLAKLAASGLTAKHAQLLHYQPMMATDVARVHPTLPLHRDGFKIPYFTLQGEQDAFFRFRALGQRNGWARLLNTKELRYAQEPDTLNELYLPPFIDWEQYAASDQPLVFTEGEIKAASGTAYGWPTIGLGGVWCFKSAKHKLALLPQFAKFQWNERIVYICYDSDAATNPDVVRAQNALARELLNLKAHPYICQMPSLEMGKKTGMDDYLVASGADAFKAEVLDSAVEWAPSQKLFALNEEVIYVQDPGCILKWENRQRFSARDFKEHQYSDRVYIEQLPMPKGGYKAIEKSAAAEWLKWPGRAKVPRTTYAPGQDRITKQGELNQWFGWGTEPRQGSVELWVELMDLLFQDTLTERRYFEQWLAYPLQNPGAKMAVGAVVWSVAQGIGKTAVFDVMRRIYGEANCSSVNDSQLSSEFNEWEANKQLIYFDEICIGDASHRRSLLPRLKPKITQKHVTVNPKNIRPYSIPDCANYYFTSNEPNALQIDNNDRRFFIHESSAQPRERGFYDRFFNWIEKQNGAECVFYHLLHLDLSDFAPLAPAPMTASKQEMLESTRGEAETWAARLKENPDQVLRLLSISGPIPLTWYREEEVLHIFRQANPDIKSRNIMNIALKKVGLGPRPNQVRCDAYGRVRLRALRPVSSLLTDEQVRRQMLEERAAWRERPALFNDPLSTTIPKKAKF